MSVPLCSSCWDTPAMRGHDLCEDCDSEALNDHQPEPLAGRVPWEPLEEYRVGAIIVEDDGSEWRVLCPEHPEQPHDGERCTWAAGLLPPSVIVDDPDRVMMFDRIR